MARKGVYTKILVDEFDLSSQAMSVDIEQTVAELESTVFQATTMQYEPGLASSGATLRGYLEGKGAGTLEYELRARLGSTGTTRLGIFTLTDDAACSVLMADRGWTAGMKVTTPVAGLMTVEGNWPKAQDMKRGLRVFDGTLAATGQQTAVDFGAAGSNGGIAMLWVTAIAGTATNAAIKVQHSATQGGVYADLGTFTLSAVGSFGITFAGAVNRWLRINCTSMGGATGITCVAAAGVSGITY